MSEYTHADAMRDLDAIDHEKHSPHRAQTDRLAAYIKRLEARGTRCPACGEEAFPSQAVDMAAEAVKPYKARAEQAEARNAAALAELGKENKHFWQRVAKTAAILRGE